MLISLNDVHKLTDEELVRLTIDNQENFLHLVDRYKGRLLSYIRRLTNANQEDAEDILQEVFIKVYLNLNGFNKDLKFSSWIYRITHNQVISNHRKLRARPEGYLVTLEDRSARNLASEIDIVAGADWQIMKTSIFRVLDSLEPKYREVLILKFLEEKNYQEISDIIKKPPGTVASTISKAKQEFKKEMAKQKITL